MGMQARVGMVTNGSVDRKGFSRRCYFIQKVGVTNPQGSSGARHHIYIYIYYIYTLPGLSNARMRDTEHCMYVLSTSHECVAHALDSGASSHLAWRSSQHLIQWMEDGMPVGPA